MIRTTTLFVLLCGLCLLLLSCSEEELPSRDEIPVLRQRLFELEQALLTGERGAVDSLLSVSILDLGLGSDSLLRVVYGSNGDFPFAHLGDYEIFYSHEAAVVDCFVMDSSRQKDRPLKLHFKNVDGLWLLTEFLAGDTAISE